MAVIREFFPSCFCFRKRPTAKLRIRINILLSFEILSASHRFTASTTMHHYVSLNISQHQAAPHEFHHTRKAAERVIGVAS